MSILLLEVDSVAHEPPRPTSIAPTPAWPPNTSESGVGSRRLTPQTVKGWVRNEEGQRARCLLITRLWIWFAPSKICMISDARSGTLRRYGDHGAEQGVGLRVSLIASRRFRRSHGTMTEQGREAERPSALPTQHRP